MIINLQTNSPPSLPGLACSQRVYHELLCALSAPALDNLYLNRSFTELTAGRVIRQLIQTVMSGDKETNHGHVSTS